MVNFNNLYLKFPFVNIKRNNGQVSTIRITVSYMVKGSKEMVVNLLNDLIKEWEFTDHFVGEQTEESHRIEIQYQVKPNEVDTFLDTVSFRGKEINLI